jgi:hypothetical protein
MYKKCNIGKNSDKTHQILIEDYSFTGLTLKDTY